MAANAYEIAAAGIDVFLLPVTGPLIKSLKRAKVIFKLYRVILFRGKEVL